MELKYKFVAHYLDGKQYFQNGADVSMRNAKKSCFHDIDHERLEFFELVSTAGRSIGVSLMDGHFEIDGFSFWMEGSSLGDFRLVYWRRHDQMFSDDGVPTKHSVMYRLGWTAIDSCGNKVERVLEVD